MRVLISGFEPFGGRDINPTALLVRALEANEISYPTDLMVQSVLLPVTFENAYAVLQDKIKNFNPDVVIAFGQAAGRDSFELEAVAMNLIKAKIADNNGVMPSDEVIMHDGPPTFASTLPLQGIEGALTKAGLPVKVSNDAGAFVCNYVFYRLMESNQDTLRLCGFIHVPLLPEQAEDNSPSMSLDDMKRGLSAILTYINY